MEENLLTVKNLYKTFRSHWTYRAKSNGVKDVSFNVLEGESFALLGSNGAGKTTTIKCILGLIRPTSGEILFAKNNIFDRDKVGFLPEQPYFYQHLSVSETLNFYAGLFGYVAAKRKNVVDDVLKKLNISDLRDRKVKSLSKGQQQRVGIAQSLINDPRLLILDEPFSGLDPVSRVEIKNLFRSLKQAGKTLIISSHVLSDIEELCDRAIILKKGSIRKEVDLKVLNDLNPNDTIYRILAVSKNITEFQQDLLKMEISPIENFALPGNVMSLEFKGHEVSENALRKLLANKVPVLEFSKKLKSLEDIFVEVSRGDA